MNRKEIWVRLSWGDTPLAERCCRPGCDLLIGTEPDCDLVLPPFAHADAWRHRFVRWEGEKPVVRVPTGAKVSAACGEEGSPSDVDVLLPVISEAPIRLSVRVSTRLASRSQMPVLAALVALLLMTLVVLPPLGESLRGNPDAAMTGQLAPIFLRVRAEGGRVVASGGASSPREVPEGPDISTSSWVALVSKLLVWRDGSSGLSLPTEWQLGRRSDRPGQVEAELDLMRMPGTPVLKMTRAEQNPTWVPAHELPQDLQQSIRSCLHKGRASDPSWIWITGWVNQGVLKNASGVGGPPDDETTCITERLEGKHVPVQWLESPVYYAVHRPGTPRTPWRRPQDYWFGW